MNNDPTPRNAYEARVLELEEQGCTTSDAQGIADAEGLDASLDVDTIEPREKLAQFKQTDAQRLALLSDDYQEALGELTLAQIALDVVWQERDPQNIAAKCCSQRIGALLKRANHGRLAK